MSIIQQAYSSYSPAIEADASDWWTIWLYFDWLCRAIAQNWIWKFLLVNVDVCVDQVSLEAHAVV